MRAVIYCRVSTVEQVQNLSLATQEESCRAYCAREGYDVDELFIDAGESAKTTNRPEFLRLLEACRQGQGRLHAVIVYSLTRFSRNSADHHAISTLLRGLGISLRSVTEPIDDSPSGRLMEGILAAMAQFDNDSRSARVVAGMKAATDRGRWIWPAPIGYLTGTPKQRGASIVPDPDRAPLIRAAFESVAESRLTGRRLREHLTAQGLRTRRGVPISLRLLYVLLRNPVYVGDVATRGGIRRRGDFEPLVSETVFARVQARLSARGLAIRQAVRHVNHPDFPLRRFVRCAECQGQLTGSWSAGRSRRYGFYHCRRGCTRVGREALESAFLALLDALAPKAGYLRVFRAVILELWAREQATATAEHRRQRVQVTKLEAQLESLDRAFIFDQRIDDQSYRHQRDLLREQSTIAKLRLSDSDHVAADIESMLAFAEYAITESSRLWTAAASVEERIRLQTTFFPAGLRWKMDRTVDERTAQGPPRGNFVEPLNCLSFYELEQPSTEDGRMVDRPAPSWHRVVAFLMHMQQLAPAA